MNENKMNVYQTAVNDIFDAKLKKYRLHPEMLTDKLQNELYGEAIREAQMQCATFVGARP